MKKLAMLLMLLMAVSMGGHHVFSQSVTITLMPGWNWISCPMMDTLDFDNLFIMVTDGWAPYHISTLDMATCTNRIVLCLSW